PLRPLGACRGASTRKPLPTARLGACVWRPIALIRQQHAVSKPQTRGSTPRLPDIGSAALDEKQHFDESIPPWRFRVKALRGALRWPAQGAPISFRRTRSLLLVSGRLVS